MKNLFLGCAKYSWILLIGMLLPTSCGLPTYANHIHLKVGEVALAGYNLQGIHFIVPLSSEYPNKKAVTL